MGQCIITHRGGGAENLTDYLKKYLVSDYSTSLNSYVITIPYDENQSLFCKDHKGKYWVIPLVQFKLRIQGGPPNIAVYEESGSGIFYFSGTVSESSLNLKSWRQAYGGGVSWPNFSEIFAEMKILRAIP